MPVTQPHVKSWWGQEQEKSQVVARQGQLANTVWLKSPGAPVSVPVPAKELVSRGRGEDEAIPSREGHEAKGVEAGTGLRHRDIQPWANLSPQISAGP